MQWSALIGVALICSCIAARLGANERGQLLGAVAGITIPAGVAQATGTYNDLVAALWIGAFAYFVLRFGRLRDWESMAGMALSSGLAVLTKGTAFIFCFPFDLVALLTMARAWRGKAVLALGLIAGVILLINGPFIMRLHRAFGVWLYSAKVEGATLQNSSGPRARERRWIRPFFAFMRHVWPAGLSFFSSS